MNNWYDIRQHGPDSLPAATFRDYSTNPEIMKKVGARETFEYYSAAVEDQFSSTGDRKTPSPPLVFPTWPFLFLFEKADS
jgi:hypothetical protein